MDPQPWFSSDVKTDDATHIPRGYENVYYSCNEAFGEGQDRLPKLIWKQLERARKRVWLGVFIMVREWGLDEVSHVQAEACRVWVSPDNNQRRKHPGFPISLPRCRAEGKEWDLKHKLCSKPNTKKWHQNPYCIKYSSKHRYH